MKSYSIETAHNVSIAFRPATIGDRILAAIIDWLVIGLYLLLTFNFIINFTSINWLFYIGALPALMYHLLMEYFFHGQSPGKLAMRLQVMRINGSEADFTAYFLRWVFRLLEITLTLGVAALLTVIINGRGQRLGDIAAGTALVCKPTRKSRSFLDQLDADDRPVTFPQVTHLSQADFALIREALESYNFEPGNEIMIELRDNMLKKMGAERKSSARKDLEAMLNDFKRMHYDNEPG